VGELIVLNIVQLNFLKNFTISVSRSANFKVENLKRLLARFFRDLPQ
jgi:hypothetical protein